MIGVFSVLRKRAVDIKSVLPARHAISSHTANEANTRISRASGMLQPFRDHSGAISIDYGKRVEDYLAVVCHFIEADADGWRMRSLPVGFEMSDAETKEGPQVFLDLLDAVELVGLSEQDLEGAFCVTDEGSNVSRMAREYMKRIFRSFCT